MSSVIIQEMPDQMTLEEFGQQVKSKYPAYKGIGDRELAQKMIAKYPQYGAHIKYAGDTMSATTPQESEANRKRPVREAASEGSAYDLLANKATTFAGKYGQKFMTPVASTVGGMVAGPAGAAVGAMLSEAGQEEIDDGKVDLKKVAISGAENAALEYVGGTLLPRGLTKIANKAAPRAAQLVNDYLGLSKTSLPKFGRTIQNAQEIGRTVLEKVGIKSNLEAQKAAIETTRQAYDDATKKIVASPGGKLADVQASIYDNAVKLSKEVELGMWPEATSKVVDANLDEMIRVSRQHAASGDLMNPQEMHTMRKSIQQQIKDWNPDTKNLNQKFLQTVYHDLNDQIARSLPKDASAQFLKNNRIQSKLITARAAAESKLLQGELKATPGMVSRAGRTAAGAAIGAGGGAIYGSQNGHMGRDAAIGAAVGAGGELGFSRLKNISTPRADVIAQRAAGAAASKLATVSKASPALARMLYAVQSRPQNQP